MRLPERDTPMPSTEAFYGGLPTGWTERRLRFLCQIIPSNVDKHSRDDELPVELCNYTDVYYNDRITLGIQFMEATATPEQIARFGLQAGDTVITKDSETADDIGIPAFVPNTLPGVVCGYHLTILRPGSDVEGRFIHWYFQAVPVRSRLATLATGLTRVGLSQQALKDLVVPLPSLDEQCRISAFLDHETARIDELVREQEQLIGLLKEKRHAVISHIVTKGLNPKVPMKDSGTKWLGQVPVHWEIVPSHRLFIESKERARPTDELLSATQRYGVILQKDFQEMEGRRVTQVTRNLEQRKHVELDDFVISMRSFQGGIERAKAIGSVRSSYIVLRPSRKVHAGYYSYLLKSTRYILALQQTANFLRDGQDLTLGNFREVALPTFSIGEQSAISDYLDGVTARIDKLMHEAERLIELQQERRAALISAAVTGQLDLRDWQPPEPESIAEVA